MDDPLTRQTVDVLWVKGSGGDIASMKLDGFATLYLDKLDALKALYDGLESEDAMVGYLVALHVRSEPARDEHRHHAPRVHSSSPYRSHACRRHHRHRGGAQRRTADAHDFRRCAGVGAVAAPWIRPGPEGWRRGIGSGARRTGAGQSRADHMGRDVAGLLRCDAPRDSTGGRLARREQQGRTVRAGCGSAPAARRAPRRRSTDCARAARHAESARQQGDALGRFRCRAGVRRQRPLRGARRARHHLSGSLSAHENPAAVRAVRSAERIAGGSDRAAGSARGAVSRLVQSSTTNDASGATRRRCAIRIRC